MVTANIIVRVNRPLVFCYLSGVRFFAFVTGATPDTEKMADWIMKYAVRIKVE